MEDCRLSPRPQAPIKLICAGQSDAGMAFTASMPTTTSRFGKGINTPTAFAPTSNACRRPPPSSGRDVATYVLFMIIADETDDEAKAKWDLYKSGADHEALALADQPGARRHQVAAPTPTCASCRPEVGT